MLSGEGVNFVNIEGNWISNGKIITNAIVIPDIILGHMLWTHSCKLEIGPYAGAYTDHSVDLVSWSFKWNNNLFDQEGYHPGSNYQTTDDPLTGAIRGRLEYGMRDCELNFKVRAVTDQFKQDMENNTALKGRISMIGQKITVGQPELYSAILDFPSMKYNAAPWTFDDGRLGMDITVNAFYDDVAANYVTLTVVNEDVAYPYSKNDFFLFFASAPGRILAPAMLRKKGKVCLILEVKKLVFCIAILIWTFNRPSNHVWDDYERRKRKLSKSKAKQSSRMLMI